MIGFRSNPAWHLAIDRGRKSIMPLSGSNILVVEDDWFIASMIGDALDDAGARVIGPFDNMIEALGNLSDLTAIDAAILDIGLGEATSYPLAEALRMTHIPFIFLTGRSRDELPAAFTHANHMLKPFQAPQLIEKLVEISEHKSR